MKKRLDRSFLKEHLGDFLQIATKETMQLGKAYFGVLKKFEKDIAYLDTDIKLDYNDIISIIIMDIN